MGWRKIQKDDIKRGTVVRLKRMIEDGSFGMATIIAVHHLGAAFREVEGYWPHVILARPYAYAWEHFNSNTPLLGSENFEYGIDKMLDPNSDVEVYQSKDGIRNMMT